MTDDSTTEKAPLEGRHPDGRFAHGNNLGTPWGPDNPPPRSRGRPRKDAWVRELEQRLDDPRLRQALADMLIKTALKGGDRARLQALEMIQDRVGGPVTRSFAIDADLQARAGVLVVPAPMSVEDWIRRENERMAMLTESGRAIETDGVED